MAETPNQFVKAPRRKREAGRRVAVSPEAKLAYEAEIKARTEREETYLRHLPDRDVKR